MKKGVALISLLALLSLLLIFVLSGCATMADSGLTTSYLGVGAGLGYVYTDMQFSAPSINYVTGDGNEVGSKTGSAKRTSILGLVAFGDSSIATAARNGGINKIKTVNYELYNLLFGLYTKSGTIVTGE